QTQATEGGEVLINLQALQISRAILPEAQESPTDRPAKSKNPPGMTNQAVTGNQLCADRPDFRAQRVIEHLHQPVGRQDSGTITQPEQEVPTRPRGSLV